MSQAASSPFAEVRLLGPVELGRRDGSSAGVGSGLERTLLAALAVNAGLVVSTGDLIDGLWGSAPPPTARHALQVHVSSLRHRLGVSPSPLEARPSGYVLKLDPGQLDTERFESLAASGRAELASNQPTLAADALEAALAVWRGPALADVAGDRLTGTEVARLEEARRATEEDRLDAELAAGRSDRAAAMAEALADAEPFRERRWGQLMLALYRSGRQAEALRRFVLVGDLLRDELGVDPSPALRDLHRGILTHDPGLELADLPAPPGGPGDADPPVTRFTRRGGSALAYQVLGDGPIDLVFLPGFTGHLEIRWEDPTLSRLFRRLAASSRLVLLDKRGTGMSDRAGGYPPLPEHVDDLLAVMDAVGSRRAALFGVLDGGAIALLTAIAHPDRVAGVATYATAPVLSASDYPPGATPDQLATLQTLLSRLLDVDEVLPLWAPSKVGDAAFSRWLTRYMRMGAGVGGAVEIVQRLLETDLRDVLAKVTTPALVLHRRGDRALNAGNATYLADHLPQARLVLLPGDDTVLWAGDVDPIAEAIETWLRRLPTDHPHPPATRPAVH
jgi:DNA-binding SARP family transcriptional activator/pimeloyl-ACP methyl ester carboxylesterase